MEVETQSSKTNFQKKKNSPELFLSEVIRAYQILGSLSMVWSIRQTQKRKPLRSLEPNGRSSKKAHAVIPGFPADFAMSFAGHNKRQPQSFAREEERLARPTWVAPFIFGSRRTAEGAVYLISLF
jgi:hypothetical protein